MLWIHKFALSINWIKSFVSKYINRNTIFQYIFILLLYWLKFYQLFIKQMCSRFFSWWILLLQSYRIVFSTLSGTSGSALSFFPTICHCYPYHNTLSLQVFILPYFDYKKTLYFYFSGISILECNLDLWWPLICLVKNLKIEFIYIFLCHSGVAP